MLFRKRSIEEAARESANKAGKKTKAAEAKKEKKLQVAFNAAAKLEEALKAIQEANPNFEFLSENTASGAFFVTNVPIKGRNGKEDLTIAVDDKGIHLAVDPHDVGFAVVKYRYIDNYNLNSAKQVAKKIGKLAGKRVPAP